VFVRLLAVAVLGVAVGVVVVGTAVPAEAASCKTADIDAYAEIGTHYPFSWHGRVVRLYNGRAFNDTYAVLGAGQAGDQLLIQRGTVEESQTWIPGSWVQSAQGCPWVTVPPGQYTAVTRAWDNWKHPVRACLYIPAYGTYCHNWWYVDLG
jgi:hypothetical protein